MEYVLGIDLGTSYFKLGLFDKKSKLCGLGRIAVEKDTGDGSLCELPTERFWNLLQKGLRDACKQAKAEFSDIKAIGYSSQASSFLLLDEHDTPLTPLILWPDQRADDVFSEVKKLWQQKDFLRTTGLGIDCNNQLCINKLLWFKKERPDIWKKAKRAMTISDYLTFSLTGQYSGDSGTASLLGLLDVQRLKWWNKAFDILGLDTTMFSNPLCPGTILNGINKTKQQFLGLNPDVPFVIGSLDHHVAAIGAGVGTIADISESTGTVLACVNFTKKYDPQKNICIGPGLENGHFYQLTFDANGAAGLQWYQETYAPDLSIEQLVQMAEKVKPGCEGLMAHSREDTYKSLSDFKHIKDSHGHGHFVRAIMESTARSLVELIHKLSKEKKPQRIVATGGGAKSDLWLQIKVDLTNTEFITTACDEPACSGAAMLTAAAAGWFEPAWNIPRNWATINKSFQP